MTENKLPEAMKDFSSLPSEKFLIEKLKQSFTYDIDGNVTSYRKALDYLNQYVYITYQKSIYFYLENKVVLYKKEDLDNIILSLCPKKFKVYYYSNAYRYIISNDNKKPFKYNDENRNKYINFAPNLRFYNTNKKYNDFDDEVKSNVDFILSFFKEFLTDEQSYIYIMKYIKNLILGNKNDVCIVLKGEQRIGKSAFYKVIVNLLGDKLAYTSATPETFIKQFNGHLQGKMLVVIEDKHTFKTELFNTFSERLKCLITENTITIEEKI
jgi:hypothetical protein